MVVPVGFALPEERRPPAHLRIHAAQARGGRAAQGEGIAPFQFDDQRDADDDAADVVDQRTGLGLQLTKSLVEAKIQHDPKNGDFYIALIEKPGRILSATREISRNFSEWKLASFMPT